MNETRNPDSASLAARLAALGTAEPEHTCLPVPFDLGRPEARLALDDLLASGQVTTVHDSIGGQLEDLARSRTPGVDLQGEALAEAVAELLDGQPIAEYGTWFHLPWQRCLVHVLPKPTFRELRSDRNRHKITAVEQEKLARLRIGVVGLSVGQAIAVCMAQEGVGGTFRLADFDRLDLSNLNRLRGGIDDIGRHKVSLAARAMVGLDPYLQIEPWFDGLQPDRLDAFLLGNEGDAPLDLLVEECDDLALKIRLRERARRHGIPVLMATSERGLLDLERFDLEPERSPFHGLVGGLDLDAVAAGDEDAKIEFAMRALGLAALSTRGAASLVEMGETLSTWPQLASAVSLGAAVATDAARRVALGQLRTSGRFAIDLDRLITDGQADLAEPAVDSEQRSDPVDDPGVTLPSPTELNALGAIAGNRPTDALVRALVTHAVQAPTGGNAQPWRFTWDGQRLRCQDDPNVAVPAMDPDRKSVQMALGSAVENLGLAAAAAGFAVDVSPVAELREWDLQLRPAPVAVHPLLAQLAERATNRRKGDSTPLGDEASTSLVAAAAERGVKLRLVTGAKALAALGEVFGAADRVRFLSPAMLAEMNEELRWSADEAQRTGDGLDVATLELGRGERAALRLLLHAPVMAELGRMGLGRALQKPSREATRSASAVGQLEVPGHDDAAWFAAGRALQRLWLRASALGLWLHPMATVGFLFRLVDQHDGAGLAPHEVAEVKRLRPLYERWLPVNSDTPTLAFRLFRAPPPGARSLRRPVDRVLSPG